MGKDRRVRCNHCMSIFDEEHLIKTETTSGTVIERCPVCDRFDAIMDVGNKENQEKKRIGEYKLLPCPCCGNYPSVRTGQTDCVGQGSYVTRITIKCKCGISLSKKDWDEPDKIWNARTVTKE
jgi:hypothetical protein